MEQIVLNDSSLKGILPSSFHHGFAGASYQIEGGYDADGKGPNVWDEFMKTLPFNGNDACNSYYQWKDDIAVLKAFGAKTYRFSISWARVIPLGGEGDPVNQAGLKYYSDLVDALLEAGIEPFVTIYHWDHPLELEKRYGAWFSKDDIIRDFINFAKVVFEALGDRVKNWCTINEPHINTMLMALSYKKDQFDLEKTWPRLCKTMLLAHGHVVKLYREKYQQQNGGKIGIALNCDWAEPIDDSEEARSASEFYLSNILGMYADPLYLGKFPQEIIDAFPKEPLEFSEDEWKVVHGSTDFFGLNTYGTKYTTGKRFNDVESATPIGWFFGRVELVERDKEGNLIGVKGENGHPYAVPWGFRKLLKYIHNRYTGPSNSGIIITENGFPVEHEEKLAISEAIHDSPRQEYFATYLKEMLLAVREDGVRMDGYLAWSLLDNLEWIFGYGPRFGLTAIDREDGYKRHPKDAGFVIKKIFDYAVQR